MVVKIVGEMVRITHILQNKCLVWVYDIMLPSPIKMN